jgi:Amidase
VAAGLIPAAVASDTGGSIRIPAALCGVAGIKPTFGRIPRDGCVPLAPCAASAASFPEREPVSAPDRHLPQATTGPAVTAAGAHQAGRDER